MNMIENLLLFGFGAFIACCLALAVLCLVHSCTNPYSMDSAMKELKERCETKDGTVKKLNEIMLKMFDCPPIDKKMSVIEVADFGDLKVLIGGDESGKPRLFAFNAKMYSRSNYHQLRNTDSFKKFGIKYSISASELSEFLTEVSKVVFKKKLEEQSRKNLINHFNV
jgi:hypothetical protein